MEKRLSENIKIAGFIMTCFMVFYHVGNLGADKSSSVIDAMINTQFNYIFSTMGMVIMSHFFSVTGFLLFYGLSYANYKEKMKRRVFSLLIPYIIWQIIIAIKNMIQEHNLISLKEFLIKTFCFGSFPFNGAMWYVYAVFFLALLSPIMIFLLRDKKSGWIIVVCLIILFKNLGKIPIIQDIISYGLVGNIIAYMPAYLVGVYFGRFYDEISKDEYIIYIIAIIFVSLLLDGITDGIFRTITVQLLPMTALLYLPAYQQITDKRIYHLTFLIYAIHVPVIGDFKPILLGIYNLNIPISLSNLLIRFSVLTLDILISSLIFVILNKISPKSLNLITGGRAC